MPSNAEAEPLSPFDERYVQMDYDAGAFSTGSLVGGRLDKFQSYFKSCRTTEKKYPIISRRSPAKMASGINQNMISADEQESDAPFRGRQVPKNARSLGS